VPAMSFEPNERMETREWLAHEIVKRTLPEHYGCKVHIVTPKKPALVTQDDVFSQDNRDTRVCFVIIGDDEDPNTAASTGLGLMVIPMFTMRCMFTSRYQGVDIQEFTVDDLRHEVARRNVKAQTKCVYFVWHFMPAFKLSQRLDLAAEIPRFVLDTVASIFDFTKPRA